MSSLINNFKKLYPSFRPFDINGNCVISELEHVDDNGFKQLIISDVIGWQFPHEMPKKLSSIFCMSQEGIDDKSKQYYAVLRLDCDGIFCVEKDKKLTLYICELKSSFSVENICKAKNQIVGSLIKTLGLLNLLQEYSLEDIEIKGVIISYVPSVERITSLKMDSRPDYFCMKLYKKGSYSMLARRCEFFWHPLAFKNNIDLVYIGVPKGNTKYSICLSDIEQKFLSDH